jgi:hypothetical protein
MDKFAILQLPNPNNPHKLRFCGQKLALIGHFPKDCSHCLTAQFELDTFGH